MLQVLPTMSDSWDCERRDTSELSDIVGSICNTLGQRGTMPVSQRAKLHRLDRPQGTLHPYTTTSPGAWKRDEVADSVSHLVKSITFRAKNCKEWPLNEFQFAVNSHTIPFPFGCNLAAEVYYLDKWNHEHIAIAIFWMVMTINKAFIFMCVCRNLLYCWTEGLVMILVGHSNKQSIILKPSQCFWLKKWKLHFHGDRRHDSVRHDERLFHRFRIVWNNKNK